MIKNLIITSAALAIAASSTATEIEIPTASVYWHRIFISAEPSEGGTVSGYEFSDYWGIGAYMTSVAQRGYRFENWTLSENIVGWNPSYQIFANWSDVVYGTPGELHYTAHFSAVEYAPENTTYSGLFISPDEPSHTNSGFISVSTTSKGSYSAKLLFRGVAYHASGKFASNGTASFSIASPDQKEISVALHAQLGTAHMLTGVVSNSASTNGWTAELVAYHAGFDTKTNPAPIAGPYTLIIPASGDAATAPAGNGFGSIRVDSSGRTSLSGSLADGTKVSQKLCVLENGLWPFYASSGPGGGSILGWLIFTNLPDSDISGTVVWTKAPRENESYPNGFSLTSNVNGSSFKFQKGANALDLTNGIIVLQDQSTSESITNQILFYSNNRITGPNGVKLTVDPTTGLLKGEMITLGNSEKVSIRGVIFQKSNSASGLFTGASRSGSVYIGPQPQ